jgi:hypothetical protein
MRSQTGYQVLEFVGQQEELSVGRVVVGEGVLEGVLQPSQQRGAENILHLRREKFPQLDWVEGSVLRWGPARA